VKILLYGDAALRGSGGYCYALALRELGHEVICADSDEGFERYRQLHWRVVRRLHAGPLARHRREHAALLVATARRERPQIVIILKGVHIGGDAVRALKQLGAWVAIINHDDFFSQNPVNRSLEQQLALPAYDFVFVTREVNVAEVRPANPHVEFFPFAYHPAIHRPVAIPSCERAQWTSDVAFVGSWERERAGLLEELVRRVPARYAIWGSMWERAGRRSPLQPYLHKHDVLMDEMAKAIAGSQIALGFLRKKNRDDYTQRTFEIPACGGLLLAERTARHLSLYREGVEAEFFDPVRPDELIEKVRALLGDDERRARLREAGRAALLRQHQTYRDRLERLLQLYAARR
jgi:spore maturation protein CgeB